MATLKELATSIVKLDRFDGGNFMRWKKSMHFLLVSLQIVYVLSTLRPEEKDNETLAESRKRQKWDTDYEICKGHIMNAMGDSLFDIYNHVPTAKKKTLREMGE